MTTSRATHERQAALHSALVTVRHSVSRLHELLKLKAGFDLDAFTKVLDSKLLTQLDPDYPLMVAITGGGSTGKSSLFNALVGKPVGAVKARAGLSRRAFAAIHPSLLARPGFLASLFEAFGCDPEPLGSADELTTPGIPKYVPCESVPANLVLLDTPDFDTGDRSGFLNRSAAKPILEACDVFLYIFTNATYNNRDNTGFLRDILTGVGNRKSALVYRCSRMLTEEEIREHAEVVTRNIYGQEGNVWCLGIYRVSEDDEVAAGRSFMRVDPLPGGAPLVALLARLDCAQTRADVTRSALRDVRRDAQATLDAATLARCEIELYQGAVRIATSWAAANALKAFPQRDLLKRFLEIWEQTQPLGVRMLRKAGRAIGAPFNWFVRIVFPGRDPPAPREADPEEVFRKNLSEAAHDLRNDLLGRDLSVPTSDRDPAGGRMANLVKRIRLLPGGETAELPIVEALGEGRINLRLARPESVASAGAKGPGDWKERLGRLHGEASGLVGVTSEFDGQLREIAERFRHNMSGWARLRETLTASLPSLAAVAAVTYVIATCDPVGAGTIYAKLGTLFGLNDLWALVAIPAATGLAEIDRRELQRFLTPIYEEWFKEKAESLCGLLEREVAGAVMASTGDALSVSEKPWRDLDTALSNMSKGDTS